MVFIALYIQCLSTIIKYVYLSIYSQVLIRILDVNDNPPIFTQPLYQATIAENVAVQPPAAILQVSFYIKNIVGLSNR